MTLTDSVQAYVERQPSLAWRRSLMRTGIRFLGFKILWDVSVTGAENVPDSGPAILMMNHISLLDPVLCMGAVTNRFVIPMTKVENMHNPLLNPFIRFWGAYSVSRGEVDRRALTNSIELLKSGQLILIAPEGTRQRNGLTQPKEGLAYIATKANAVIVPAAISGAIGWERNLKKLTRTPISVNFGRPFRFRTGANPRASRDALPAMMDEAMYQLALAVTDINARGVYSDLSKATTEHLEFLTPDEIRR
jgi:1-acyl-sn-glycerol-3-phosphate acyltransferase